MRVWDDDVQPQIKPRYEPGRLTIRRVLQITNIMRGKPWPPFEGGIDRYHDAESRA